MQVWPAPPVKTACVLAPATAMSMSASAKTIFGDFPPSSKARCLSVGAARSLITRAVSVANTTLPAHAAILTGRHPQAINVPRNSFPLDDSAETLPQVDLARIRIPPPKRGFFSVDWQSRFVFDVQLPRADVLYEIRRARAREGTHPGDVGTTLEQVYATANPPLTELLRSKHGPASQHRSLRNLYHEHLLARHRRLGE